MRAGKEVELKVSWDRQIGFRTGEDGVTVSRVSDNSVASKAGLKAGDKVLKIDGKDVADLAAMRAAFRDGGKKAKVRVLRDGKETDVEFSFEW
jgi:S1-C subfamily serine protease